MNNRGKCCFAFLNTITRIRVASIIFVHMRAPLWLCVCKALKGVVCWPARAWRTCGPVCVFTDATRPLLGLQWIDTLGNCTTWHLAELQGISMPVTLSHRRKLMNKETLLWVNNLLGLYLLKLQKVLTFISSHSVHKTFVQKRVNQKS